MLERKPSRLEKIQQHLDNRQVDLTVFMEEVHKPHNLAAIIRTADAVGIGHVHATFRKDVRRFRGHHTASGSKRWVKTHRHQELQAGLDLVKAQGMQLVVAHFSDKAVDFKSVDYTKPTCLLVGTELEGVSDAAIEQADHEVVIPMLGMVQSLNVSVATALILYEAQRQRVEANMYGQRKVEQAECDYIIFCALQPQVKRFCDRFKIRYPRLNELGDVDDPEWDKIRKSL